MAPSPPKPSTAFWNALKGRYAGQRGFVIGNGPSLRIEDLDALQGEVTIASNKVYLAFQKTGWRPSFFTIADALVIEKVKLHLAQVCGTVIAPTGTWHRWPDEQDIRYFHDLGGVRERVDAPYCFSDDIAAGAYAGYTITFFNLQLAAHLGLNPIYLLGCDHNYAGEHNVKPDEKVVAAVPNHFIEGYRRPGEVVNAAPIRQMDLAFTHARAFSDASGIDIRNATRGGALEIFQRSDLDRVLAKPRGRKAKRAAPPKISVCMPVWNGMPYLREALNSLLSQSFTDFELIVVDGGSTDGTLEEIERFRVQHPRVTLTHRPPDGIYNGLNAAIEKAVGEYVYILMADDYVRPDTLGRFAALLDAHPDCGIAQSSLDVVDGAGRPVSKPERWHARPFPSALGSYTARRHKRLAPFDALATHALNTTYTSLTQIMVRRDVYHRNGLFRQDFGSFGDLEWQMRAASLTSTIYTPEPLATWRRHAAQASNSDKHRSARADGVFSRMVDDNFPALSAAYPQWETLLLEAKLHHVYAGDARKVAHALNGGRRIELEGRLAVAPRALEIAGAFNPIGNIESPTAFKSALALGLRELIVPLPVEDLSGIDLTPREVAIEDVYGKRPKPAEPEAEATGLATLMSVLLKSPNDQKALAELINVKRPSVAAIRRLLFTEGILMSNIVPEIMYWFRNRANEFQFQPESLGRTANFSLAEIEAFFSAADPVGASYGGAKAAERVGKGDVAWYEKTGDDDIRDMLASARTQGIDLPVDGTWLEFGCGIGRVTRALARTGRKVVGVDVSARMVAAAQSFQSPVPSPQAASFAAIEPDDSAKLPPFDHALSLFTLHYMPEALVLNAVERLAGGAAPGGFLALHFLGSIDRFRPPTRPSVEGTRGFHPTRQAGLLALAARQGCDVLAVMPAYKINSFDMGDYYLFMRKR